MIKKMINKYLISIRYVYVFVCPSFLYIAKIGISDNVSRRRKEVEGSIRGKFGENTRVVKVFYLPMLFPLVTEAGLHRFVSGLKTRIMSGTNGHSEWFYCLNIISGFVVFLFSWAYNRSCPHYLGIATCLMPIPIDFCLLVVLIAAFQYLSVATILYLIYYFII